MTVTATNGNVPNLALLLQQYGAKAASTTSSIPPLTTTRDGDKDPQGLDVLGMPQPFGGMRGRFETSIADALIQAPAGSDPNQIIQDTLAELMNNELANLGGSRHGRGKDGDKAKVDPNADSPQAQFLQMLQAHGVDAQQFQKDLQLALAKVQNGAVDLSGPFANFPPGAEIDAVA